MVFITGTENKLGAGAASIRGWHLAVMELNGLFWGRIMEGFGNFGLKGRLSPWTVVGSCCIRQEENAKSSADLAYGYLRGVWEFVMF